MKNYLFFIVALACASVQAQVVPTGYNITYLKPNGLTNSAAQFVTSASEITSNGTILGNVIINGVNRPYTWHSSTGFRIVLPPPGTEGMNAIAISEGGKVGGVIWQNNVGRGFILEPNGSLNILPLYSNALVPYDEVHDLNDSNDVMLWSKTDTSTNGDSFVNSRWFHSDGSVTLYTESRGYFLPNPSGLQRYNWYPRDGVEGLVRIDGSNVIDPGPPLNLQDDDDIYSYREGYEPNGSGWRARLQRWGTDGSLLWESPAYGSVGTLVTPKNVNIGYIGARLTPGSAYKPYITLFGGGMVDMTPLLPSNLSSVTITGANDAGQLIGYGTVAGVQNQYFVLTPVPEPATMVAIGLGLAGLARKRKKTA